MLKRVITLLFCLIIVFVAIFGFSVGVVAVPTFISYADDESPTLIPYEDQMHDSMASIIPYMVNFGLKFGNYSYDVAENVDRTANNFVNDLNKFCIGTNKSLPTVIETLKKGTGLVDGENGQYYYSPEAQDLLNEFINWYAAQNNINDGVPANITLGDNGQINGYGVFLQKGSSTNFEWGSCQTLGCGLLPIFGNYTNNSIGSIVAPWGSQTYKVSKGSSYCTLALNSHGLSSSILYFFSDGRVRIYGAPCYVVLSSNLNKIYYGCVYLTTTYNTSNQVTNRQYSLVYGDVYQTLNQPAPIGTWNVGYDGTPLPDDSVPAADPVTLPINYNTYNNIIKNIEDVTVNNNNSDDDTIIYNPYPDNPNYDPNDPSTGTTTGPINGNGNGGNNNQGSGSDGVINFPNINFDLPEINWSLGDLSNKFPFSIPFDLVNLVTVLDAPAEAPRFEGTVDFGFTTWDYDINLESFDTVAAVCRITELIAFIFGLILITRNIIKG